jgi:hypothetical protein
MRRAGGRLDRKDMEDVIERYCFLQSVAPCIISLPR